MITWIKMLGKLIVLALVGLVLDGVILRDLWVELRNGYNISATNWSEPCQLTYFPFQDPRPPSPWVAIPADGAFVLSNRNTLELRQFASLPELQQAACELGVRPLPGQPLTHDVSGFNADERYVIGQSADGWFLFDLTTDTLDMWPTVAEWTAAVRARTTLNPQRLHDPKDWWLQRRDSTYWTIMGGYLTLGAAWLIVPLMRSHRRHSSTPPAPAQNESAS